MSRGLWQIGVVPKAEREREQDGYKNLVAAIIARAVGDATGHCDPACSQPWAKVQDEAQRWLADGHLVTELLELAGYDAERVLPQLRQVARSA